MVGGIEWAFGYFTGFLKENPFQSGMPINVPDLNSQIRRYTLKKYGVNLSEAEADLALESLADLFLAFADTEEKIASAGLLMKPDEAIFAGKIPPPIKL